jgi:crotonobetainyl-CoA:carnitine CoA-transferase CaiB-like acyl-CoA transferase
VLNPADAIDDPHLKAVGMIDVRDHPSEGPYRYVRDGPRLSETPMGLHRHAPRLGQHTREVLTNLGYDPTQIDELVTAGVAVADGGAHAP